MRGERIRVRVGTACALSAIALFAPACGLGTAGAVASIPSGSSPVSIATSINKFGVTNTTDGIAKVGPAKLTLDLVGPTGGTPAVSFYFQVDGTPAPTAPNAIVQRVENGTPEGSPEIPIGTPAAVHTLTTTGDVGEPYTFLWDFSAIGTGYKPKVTLWATVGNQQALGSGNSEVLGVGNDLPEVSCVRVVSADLDNHVSGVVQFSYDLCDSSEDELDVTVQFSTVAPSIASASDWRIARAVGVPPGETPDPSEEELESTSICNTNCDLPPTNSSGTHTFLWDSAWESESAADLPEHDGPVWMRFTPYDIPGGAPGVQYETPEAGPLLLDNNEPPAVSFSSDLILASDDERRGLVIPYTIEDPEGDVTRVVVQYSSSTEDFPSLGDVDVANLDALLADPAWRKLKRVATPLPVAWEGAVLRALEPSVGPGTANGLETDDFHSAPSLPLDLASVGVELELLRSTGPLQALGLPAAAAGSLFVPNKPVAAVPLGRGTSALVLDHAAGGWRLTRVDLALGEVLSMPPPVSSASGTPTALALSTDERVAYVASVDAGQGLVVTSVAVDTGDALPAAVTSTPFPSAGETHGLAYAAPGVLYASIGNAIWRLELPSGATSVLAEGLDQPLGIALDPRRPLQVFVAEADGVWHLDLGTRAPRQLFASGAGGDLVEALGNDAAFALTAPRALALDRSGGRLLATGAVATGPAAGQDVAVSIALGEGGAHQLGAAWAPGSGGIAAGPDGLVVAALADDLAVGGGVQQVRPLLAVEAQGRVLRTAQSGPGAGAPGLPFAPAPAPGQRWRIPRESTRVEGTGPELFVWDTRDLPGGGEVALRATPFDADAGESDETVVFKTVRPPLDVQPEPFEGSTDLGTIQVEGSIFGLHTDMAEVAFADLDRDGDLELLVALSAEPEVEAEFLRAFRRDDDGLWKPFVFSKEFPMGWVPPANPQLALEVADLNRDGLDDVITAEVAGEIGNPVSQVVVRYASALGGFESPVARELAGTPSRLHIADLSGDGVLDVVVVTRDGASDRLEVVLQVGADGGLAEPITLDPLGAVTAVATADFDGDSILDLAATVILDNVPMNPGYLRTWLGTPVGPAVGSLVSTLLPIKPAGLAQGDFNGDGEVEWALSGKGQGQDVLAWVKRGASGLPVGEFHLLVLPQNYFPGRLATADVDGDGRVDLAVGSLTLGLFALFAGIEEGVSPPPLLIGQAELGSRITDFALDDLDGDGLVDLALVLADPGQPGQGEGYQLELSVCRGRGPREFSSTPDLVLGALGGIEFYSTTRSADLDGDGDLDLVTARRLDLRVIEQAGAGVFDPPRLLPLGSFNNFNRTGLALVDMDSDGSLDAATTHEGLTVYSHLTGQPVSVVVQDDKLGEETNQDDQLLVADLDGDGLPDLVTTRQAGSMVWVRLQESGALGELNFGASQPFALADNGGPGNDRALALADLDSDGDLDLVTASGLLTSFRNNSAGGAFAFERIEGLPGLTGSLDGATALVARDVDADGRPDVVTLSAAQNAVLVYHNDGTGSFLGEVDTYSVGSPPLAELAVADVDGDGDADITANGFSQTQSSLRIWEQIAPGAFLPEPRVLVSQQGSLPQSIEVVDLDFDGDVDVTLTNYLNSELLVRWGSH